MQLAIATEQDKGHTFPENSPVQKHVRKIGAHVAKKLRHRPITLDYEYRLVKNIKETEECNKEANKGLMRELYKCVRHNTSQGELSQLPRSQTRDGQELAN